MQSGAECGTDAARVRRQTSGRFRSHPGASAPRPMAIRRRSTSTHGLPGKRAENVAQGDRGIAFFWPRRKKRGGRSKPQRRAPAGARRGSRAGRAQRTPQQNHGGPGACDTACVAKHPKRSSEDCKSVVCPNVVGRRRCGQYGAAEPRNGGASCPHPGASASGSMACRRRRHREHGFFN